MVLRGWIAPTTLETFNATEENSRWALDRGRPDDQFLHRQKDLDSEMTVVCNEFGIWRE